MLVSVKAVVGRVVRESPRGPLIPSDRFVKVNKTPYVTRLIEYHGDLIVEPQEKAAPAPAPKPKEEKEPK